MTEFLENNFIDDITFYLLTSIGYYGVFMKSHAAGWQAFIPVVRKYRLAVIAEREEEGRIFCIITGCTYLPKLLLLLYPEGSIMKLFLDIIYIALGIAAFFYGIRIYTAICDLYSRKRAWVWLWAFIPSVTPLIFGYSKSFQPSKKKLNLDYSRAAAISHVSMEAIKQGLTVNLTDRTVTDFFKKKYLLRDIHLSIPAGHMVLLLGGSGAGKTTFLNAVTGYEKANAEIVLNGTDIYNNYESMKYDLGFVPQQDLMRYTDSVYMTLNDAAALRLPKSIKGAVKKERISSVLDKFGLGSISSSLVGKLSGGQKKRLSIAMEFISDPSLFILDEPDSGLDGVVARNLFLNLRQIADEGKIVIVITHTPDRVIDLFDDCIVLAKDADRTGRLAYYGSVDEAYTFFGKNSMEEILLSINQKDEGGEGRADEFVERYSDMVSERNVG